MHTIVIRIYRQKLDNNVLVPARNDTQNISKCSTTILKRIGVSCVASKTGQVTHNSNGDLASSGLWC